MQGNYNTVWKTVQDLLFFALISIIISQKSTLILKTLVSEAETKNPRLRSPLVLYAAVAGKGACLYQWLGQSPATDEMRSMLETFHEEEPEQILRKGGARRDYQKVWEAFSDAKNAPDRDYKLKKVIRNKVTQLMQASKCSNYRIYTDLRLNPGNVNCWLKNGDQGKGSYRTAEHILDYVRRLNDKDT